MIVQPPNSFNSLFWMLLSTIWIIDHRLWKRVTIMADGGGWGGGLRYITKLSKLHVTHFLHPCFCSCPWCWPLQHQQAVWSSDNLHMHVMFLKKGYGHSMNLRAYFLMMLSSANMKSDLLTVRQFCRWGTGLYRAMVRARCALACFMEAVSPAASCASPPRSKSPSPESTVPGAHSSPNRAILQRDEETTRLTMFY